MPRRIVQDHQRNYLFSADDSAPLGSRFWAVVKLRVIDELTGTPPRGSVTLRAQERGLTPRVSSDGLIGVVGIPQHVFPALRTQNYNVHLRVEATGYIARNVEVTVPSASAFPDTFMPPPMINLALHREPIVIMGRTVQKNTNVPLAGAAVSVTGIWRQATPFDVTMAPSPPHLVSLSPPLSATRAAVAGRLRRRNLTPIVGDDKVLLEDLLAGDNPIRLSNRQNLNAGDIVLIDAAQPDLAEYIAINAITGTSSASEPADIRLDHPVVHEHRRHALVQKVSLGSQGAQNQCTDAALPGDVCVFLNTLIGLNTATHMMITGGPAPAEYHRVQRFSVTSDAAGYYRLPPLSRVAQVEIQAEKTVSGTTVSTHAMFRPDYAQKENHLDLILKS